MSVKKGERDNVLNTGGSYFALIWTDMDPGFDYCSLGMELNTVSSWCQTSLG